MSKEAHTEGQNHSEFDNIKPTDPTIELSSNLELNDTVEI